MPRQDDTDFTPRIGRIRDRGTRTPRRAPSFLSQVLRIAARTSADPSRIGGSGRTAAPRTGRFNARGRGARIVRTFPRETGWTYDVESRMRFRDRRVIVKARVVKLRGADSGAAYAHLRYLQREGAALDGERGRTYSARENEVDVAAFIDGGAEDRHQFRLIVAPEDGPELGDLRRFTVTSWRRWSATWRRRSTGSPSTITTPPTLTAIS